MVLVDGVAVPVLTAGWNFPKARPSGKRSPEVGCIRLFTTEDLIPKGAKKYPSACTLRFAPLRLVVARSAPAGCAFGVRLQLRSKAPNFASERSKTRF